MKNKKGVNVLMGNVVFIVLVLVFISLMYFAITRTGSQAVLYEQVYAKQIALIIDKAEPGVEIEVDVFEIDEIARKNNFAGNIVSIDNDARRVNVRLTNGRGYDYFYFNDANVVWNLAQGEECASATIRCLNLKVLEG